MNSKRRRGGEFKKKQKLQSKDVKQLAYKNKAPRSGEFKKKFRILAGWLCLPCCAAGESNASTSVKIDSVPELTTSVILGQLDDLPGPPRAPMGGLEKQPWMHLHGDVIKNTVAAVDGADLIKFCFSIAKKDNAKELGCQREGWQSEWI